MKTQKINRKSNKFRKTRSKKQRGGDPEEKDKIKATIDCSKIDEETLVIKKKDDNGKIQIIVPTLLDGSKRDAKGRLIPIQLDTIQDNDIITFIKRGFKNAIGEGAFNIVYSSLLSTDKCTNEKEVAVRVRELYMDNDSDDEESYGDEDGNDEESEYFIDDNDDNVLLYQPIQNSINNLITLSKAKVHPKIYDIKLIRKEGRTYDSEKVWLIVVMDKYQMNLHKFINEYKTELEKKENCEMLRALIEQTVDLCTKVAENNLFCFDMKPQNLVLNFDFEKQFIDLKIIDVDADYCIENIISKNIKDTAIVATTYKVGMLSLLAYHLYFQKKLQFNYLSYFFKSFITLHCDRNFNTYKKTITRMIRLLNDHDKEKNMRDILKHYFEIDYTTSSFNEKIQAKRNFDIGFGPDMDSMAKGIYIINKETPHSFSFLPYNKYIEKLECEKPKPEPKSEPKHIRILSDEMDFMEIPAEEYKDLPAIGVDDEPKSLPKKVFKEAKNEYLHTPLPKSKEFPPQEPADSKGGKRKTKKSKRKTKKSKRKTKKSKRKTRKTCRK